MTVIKHGIFTRVLVTAFAAYLIAVFFIDGIIKLRNRSRPTIERE
jgi:uncharacterized membrane protein